MKVRTFHRDDTEAVIDLWERCDLLRPWNNPYADIERKLAHSPGLFLVGVLDGALVAAVMAGYDGHRGWISYLGVDPSVRRLGCGRIIMEAAESGLRALGCPKINLQMRTTNRAVIEFYRRLGFTEDAVLSMGKRLVPDPPLVRRETRGDPAS